jgi:hypothetical protein
MKIVIIHYHLDSGGVTSVILNQLAALKNIKNIEKIIVISGREVKQNLKQINPCVEVVVNKDFDYYKSVIMSEAKQSNLNTKYNSIKTCLKNLIDDNTIVHAHNVNIGKNPILSVVIRELADENVKILNHIHDFAEDNRYNNYNLMKQIIENEFKLDLNNVMYPCLPNYSYAVLNTRDKKVLTKIGIKKQNMFLLSNTIQGETVVISDERKADVKQKLKLKDELPIILYPVRAIRRKNIGEFILLSILFKNKANFIISLAPESEVEEAAYNKWVDFCENNNINILFNVGKYIKDFEALVAVSSKVVSTSAAEGFGLFFIEPWKMGTSVAGREIAGITSDFIDAGIKFNLLYEKLDIPVNVFSNIEEIIIEYKNYLSQIYLEYGLEVPLDMEDSIRKIKIKDSRIDFVDLSADFQRIVIEKILKDDNLKNEIIKLNPFLDELLKGDSKEFIEYNQEIIKEKYSNSKYSKNLLEIYEVLLKGISCECDEYQNGSVLQNFINIKYLRLIQKS